MRTQTTIYALLSALTLNACLTAQDGVDTDTPSTGGSSAAASTGGSASTGGANCVRADIDAGVIVLGPKGVDCTDTLAAAPTPSTGGATWHPAQFNTGGAVPSTGGAAATGGSSAAAATGGSSAAASTAAPYGTLGEPCLGVTPYGNCNDGLICVTIPSGRAVCLVSL